MIPIAQRLALTVATGGLIGCSHAVVKLLLNHGIGQVTIAFIQIGGAGLILSIVLRFRGHAVRNDGVTRRYLLVSAVIGIAALPLLGNWVLARIPVSTFAVVATLAPSFTALFDALIERRLPPAGTLAGVGLGLAGVLLLLLPQARTVNPEQALALTVALGVPMLLAAFNVYRSRRWPQGLSAAAASAGGLIAQGLLLAPLYLAHPHSDAAALAPVLPLLGLLVAIAIASNLAGSALQRVAGAAAYSQIGYVIAVTGIAAGAVVFGESLTVLFLPALLLVFAGIVLSNRSTASHRALVPRLPCRCVRS